MPDAFVVELDDVAAGLVARDDTLYRFHAAEPRFQSLEGRRFRTPQEATRAARAILAERRKAAARG